MYRRTTHGITITYSEINFSAGDKMPDDLADEFIREADLNGDGKIDYKGRLVVSKWALSRENLSSRFPTK